MKGGIYMIIFFINKFGFSKRKTKKCISLFLCMLLIIAQITCAFSKDTAYAKDNLPMYSGSYALTDATTGRVLAGKQETNPMANASTTKILTCIVTLENCNLKDMVTISENAASQPKVRLGMGEGEQYPLIDMLYGLMLESYNDCAVAIAEHVAGSEEEFSKMLNEKAKEIGCMDTYFITPNGLDEENEDGFHHTTAVDLCNIMAYCVWESPMKETFLEITQSKSYAGTANGNSYTFTNHNALLDQMDGVLSGKTGFTSKAGYCYVAAFERDGKKFCIALLACGWPNNKTYKWQDAKTLLNYGMNNYSVKEISIEQISETIMIDGYINKADFEELNQKMKLTIEGKSKVYQVLMSENEKIEKEIILYTDADLPIKKGQNMGVCNIYIDDLLIDSISLVASDSSSRWSMLDVIYSVLYQFLTFSS